MNCVNATCMDCGAFIDRWLSGTPRVCRACLARPAPLGIVSLRAECVDTTEPDIVTAAARFTYHPRNTSDLVVLLDAEAMLPLAGGERWIFYPGRDLPSSEWHSAAQTYTRLKRLAPIPTSGVVMVQALILIHDPSPTIVDPFWREPISDFTRLGVECLPSGFSAAFIFATPVVVSSFLRAHLRRCGREKDGDLAA